MRGALTLSLFLLLGGCASSQDGSAKLTKGVRLTQYRRIGVMPFAGRSGQGKEIAEELAKALFKLRYSVVYGRQLEAALGQLGIRRGDSIGAQTMRELRRMTRVEAIFIGSVDCGIRSRNPRGSAVLLDASNNRVLFEVRFKPEGCGSEDSPKAITRQVINAMRSTMTGESEDSIGGIGF